MLTVKLSKYVSNFTKKSKLVITNSLGTLPEEFSQNLSMTVRSFHSLQLGAYYYARSKKEAERDKNRRAEIGKAKIGGTFELVIH